MRHRDASFYREFCHYPAPQKLPDVSVPMEAFIASKNSSVRSTIANMQ